MSWAVEECSRQCLENSGENKRKVLGDALFLIRFPTMPLREFANSAARARVLTAEEKCSVFEYLTCERTEVRELIFYDKAKAECFYTHFRKLSMCKLKFELL